MVASQFLDFYTSSHTSTLTFPSPGTVLPLKSEAPLIVTFYHQALNLLNLRGDPPDSFLLFLPILSPFCYNQPRSHDLSHLGQYSQLLFSQSSATPTL